MFPIGDDDTSRRTVPLVTYALIALNVLFFLVELSGGDAFIVKWAFVPSRFLANPGADFLTLSFILYAVGFWEIFWTSATMSKPFTWFAISLLWACRDFYRRVRTGASGTFLLIVLGECPRIWVGSQFLRFGRLQGDLADSGGCLLPFLVRSNWLCCQVLCLPVTPTVRPL